MSEHTTLADAADDLLPPGEPGAQPASARLVLTDAELAALERARADFAAGRTYSSSEARAATAQFLAKLRGTPVP